MLTRRIIVCLDVRNGVVVKGVKFQELREVGDPAERAAEYERQGADEIVILDVSATLEGRLAALEAVRRVREQIAIPLTVGGGISDASHAEALLDAGADRVSINSAAVARPDLIRELADRFGTQCVVVAIDAARTQSPELAWRIATRSATHAAALDPRQWAQTCQALGAGEVLLTSIDRDGTGQGYDLELLRSVSQVVSIPVIASGGARKAADLLDALNAGASAVLIASIVHDQISTVTDLKNQLAQANVEVRR